MAGIIVIAVEVEIEGDTNRIPGDLKIPKLKTKKMVLAINNNDRFTFKDPKLNFWNNHETNPQPTTPFKFTNHISTQPHMAHNIIDNPQLNSLPPPPPTLVPTLGNLNQPTPTRSVPQVPRHAPPTASNPYVGSPTPTQRSRLSLLQNQNLNSSLTVDPTRCRQLIQQGGGNSWSYSTTNVNQQQHFSINQDGRQINATKLTTFVKYTGTEPTSK